MSCNGWDLYVLGDIAEYSKEKISIDEVNTLNYISTENMLQDKNGVVEANSIPNSNSVPAYRAGNILISNIRPYFKKIWFANRNGGASTDVLVIKNKSKDIITDKFLYYYMFQDRFFDYVMSGAKGTKMPRGDKNSIMKYQVTVPTIEEQKKIIKIFENLDQKIELNNEMNKTLEEIAQSLFKRWFVDFEFPNEDREPYKSSAGEMVESELGMIPKGWEVKLISEVIEIKDGTHASPKPKEDGYPLITSKHISGDKIDFKSANLISKEDYDEVNRRSKVDTGDILISMIGTVGLIHLIQEEVIDFAIKNVGLFKTSQKDVISEYLYLFLKSNDMKNYIEVRLAGTTQKYISLGELRKIKFILPSEDVINNFKVFIEKIFNKKRKNIEENDSLIELRDSLLPKLMSGEIRIEDIEANL